MKSLYKKMLSFCIVLALTVSALPVNAQTLKDNASMMNNMLRAEDVVNVPDPRLEEALGGYIVAGQVVGYPITKGKLEKITTLILASWGIRDIEGLQYCTSARILDLGYYSIPGGKDEKNKIESIDQLSELTELEDLNLSHNQIRDISPLSELTNLTKLRLNENKISDISSADNLGGIIDISNQYIELDPVVLHSNTCEMDIINKLPDRFNVENLQIYNIEPQPYTYYKKNGKIIFENLSNSGTLSYDFAFSNRTSNGGDIFYSGTVVQDYTMGPMIEGATDKTINVGENFDPKEGVTATDYNGNDITDSIEITGNVDTSKVGKYDITYTVKDSDGNVASVTVTITVRTNEKPVIKGATDKTINIGDTFDPRYGVTASDLEDGDLTDKIVITGSVDPSEAGEYEITYTVKDLDGNETSVTITVTVIDGKLTFRVPSNVTFGPISYTAQNGASGWGNMADETLEVTDTRVTKKEWTLKARMSKQLTKLDDTKTYDDVIYYAFNDDNRQVLTNSLMLIERRTNEDDSPYVLLENNRENGQGLYIDMPRAGIVFGEYNAIIEWNLEDVP